MSTSPSIIPSGSATNSSIDVATLVGSLITAEQQPITGMNNQITSYQSKISALGTVQSALSSFQTAVQGLNSTTFNSFTATPSDSTVLSATASSIAAPGNYSLSVSQLAQSQSLAAAGQASSTSAIGNGTLTFDFGTISGGTTSNGTYSGANFVSSGAPTKSITINSGNNTLQGIRDAINAANIGVTASIINDGSASPYRLVLTSTATGVANSMKISVTGDAALSNLLSENPAGTPYDATSNPGGTQNLSQTNAAQNANFTVNGIPISKASNNVGDVVKGVTLNLTGTSSVPVSLGVGPDTTAVTQAINGFVTAYNNVVNTIQTQTSYDPTTKVAGTLQGDVSMSIIQSQMAAMINTAVGNNPNGFSNLTQIGLAFQPDGTIALNTATLNNALSSNYQDVANLFVAAGSATDSLVSYNAATGNTKDGTYGVNISQVATQGTATGNTAAGLTITSGSNDSLSLSVDGTSTTVVIPAGTYTAANLATQLQTLINSSTPISGTGKSVTVSQNAGVFTFTSNSYGSASSLLIGGGNATSNIFGTPIQTSGLDVAGTINGMKATGNGQMLTSSVGNSNGLSVLIQGSTTGSRGFITYSQGISRLFSGMMTSILGSNGPLSSETTQYNSEISDVQNRISTLNAQIAVDQANLTTQYSQLDATLGTMSSLSSYLTQQLSQLIG